MTFTLLYFVYYRCDHHKILDVSFYDDKHLSVLLVEDTEDRTLVLVQMTFTLLYFVYYRCDHHKILDVSFYDDKHLSVLLVEDTEY